MGSSSGFELGQRIGLVDFLRKSVPEDYRPRDKAHNIDDFLVAGTGYPDFRNEYPVVAEARRARSVHKYGGATLDLIL